MFNKIPTSIMLLFLLLMLVSGPVVFAAFHWSGTMTGGIITLVLALSFVALYIYTIRRYGRAE